MEDNAKTLLFGFLLFSMFAVLVLSIVNDQGNLYGRDTTLVTGGMNLTGFNRSINTLTDTANDISENFGKQNIFVTLGNLVISGFFNIALSMIQLIITPVILLNGILSQTLHVPTVVTGTLTGIISLSIIFAIWRLIKFGD